MNPPPTPSTGDVWRDVIDGPGRVLPADLRDEVRADEWIDEVNADGTMQPMLSGLSGLLGRMS